MIEGSCNLTFSYYQKEGYNIDCIIIKKFVCTYYNTIIIRYKIQLEDIKTIFKYNNTIYLKIREEKWPYLDKYSCIDLNHKNNYSFKIIIKRLLILYKIKTLNGK